MRDCFADHLCLITPLHTHKPGPPAGELVGQHPVLAAAGAAASARRVDEITVDLTGVDYLSNDALAALVGLARTLHLPQRLCLVARPRLLLHLRLPQYGGDEIATLRLHIRPAGEAGGAGPWS